MTVTYKDVPITDVNTQTVSVSSVYTHTFVCLTLNDIMHFLAPNLNLNPHN